MSKPPPYAPFFGLGLFARAFDNSPDAVEISDIEGRILYVNDAWSQLFDIEKSAAVGMAVEELPGLRESWERCIETGSIQGVHRAARSTGDQVEVSYTRTLHRNADGYPTAVITIYRPLHRP